MTPDQIQVANDIVLRGAWRKYQREHGLMLELRHLPVPAGAADRGLDKLMDALQEGAVSAWPQPEDGRITGSESATASGRVISHTPCPGGRLPAGVLEGAK